MIVPVFWCSRHPEILARGYFDQGLFEAILARQVWIPVDPITFEHHEVRGDFPDVEGALVVISARNNKDPEDVAWLLEQLERLDWSVVLLSGDEAWEFPWPKIAETPTRRVWTMQPLQEHEHLSGLIPGGWYPGTHEAIGAERERADDRPLDWFFAGQVTHERREQCVEVLRDLDGGLLYETDGYLHGMPQAEYFRLIAGAKVVPCPSGPCTTDTARVLEALEAGAVPVVDYRRPAGDQAWYWPLVSRSPQVPMPGVWEWSEFPSMLKRELERWPANANRCFAFWQAWKRRMALQLDDDLRAVAEFAARSEDGRPSGSTAVPLSQSRPLASPDDLLTVIVTTSPTPSDPWTGNLEATIESVRARLPRAEILIAIDGVRPEQADRRPAYDEYVRRLLWLANNRWHNVLPILLEEWGHQANAVRAALVEVRSPLVLFVEHDTPPVGEIDFPAVCAFVKCGAANVVRFHHETTVLDVHEHLMLDPFPFNIWTAEGPVSVRRTTAFWARPHVASTAWYRDRVLSIFAPESRTFIEDVLYGVVQVDYEDNGEAAWDRWRIWIYSPLPVNDLGIKRSTHLDGRGTDPKWPARFAYSGTPPAGAPRATVG